MGGSSFVYFTVNGVAQAAGSSVVVSAADLGTVRWVAGSGLGTDSYRVRATDGNQWSPWASGTVQTLPLTTSLTVSGEIQANTYTPGDQTAPTVAVLASGGHVVVWASNGQDGNGYGVYAQRYDANGAALGAETRINTYTADQQYQPSVAALSGGGYVVSWSSNFEDEADLGIYSQRYDANGIALGAETRANTYITNNQQQPCVAGLTGGGYVVTWVSDVQDGSGGGVYAQRYTANGMTIGGEFRVNDSTLSNQNSQSVVGLAGGGFAMTWASYDQARNYGIFTVYTKLYNASGTPTTGEIQVNLTGAQYLPSIAALADGGFVVSWQSGEIYGQIFNADGSSRSGTLLINSYTASTQANPAVTGTADGGFVATWQSAGEDGSGQGVYAQRYTANGTVIGGEFQVNSNSAGDQFNPAVAARSDGGFVTAWVSTAQDGALGGIYSRIHSAGQIGSGILVGTSGDDTLSGTSGNDTLIGAAGADTYLAGNGSGGDTIDNAGRAADGDKVLFGAGVATDHLWFQQAANDLKVSIIGTTDSVTVSGWFASDANHVATLQTADGHTLADTAVQNLVSAMASMTPPPIGQTTLTIDQHTQLDTVIAANWQSH